MLFVLTRGVCVSTGVRACVRACVVCVCSRWCSRVDVRTRACVSSFCSTACMCRRRLTLLYIIIVITTVARMPRHLPVRKLTMSPTVFVTMTANRPYHMYDVR